MLKNKFAKNDLGAIFAVAVLSTVIISLLVSFAAQIFSIDSKNYAFQLVSSALNTLAIGGSAFVYAAMSKTKIVPATKMNAKPSLAHIGWGCLTTLCLITFMIPLNGWIAQGIVALGLPEPGVAIDMDVVSMIALAAVLPAFCEEVVFRGALAGSLENNKNKLASLAIVGGLFSLFHMNPAQTVHQFVLGAFMALLYYRSGSLWTTVIVHFFNNAFVIALSAIFGSAADEFFAKNAIWLFFVGLVCFAGCVAGYLFTTKSKWQNEPAEDEEQGSKTKASCWVLLSVSAGICLIMWIFALFIGVG